MLLRRPHELAGLFRDGRKRAGWSQRELAERVGVSRQWVSLVETGKTSVEFDLVLAALQALGYGVVVRPHEQGSGVRRRPAHDTSTGAQEPTGRTPLTRDGEPLGNARRTRRIPKRTEGEGG
jgi:y4mF family transcriptional regulator